jgi:hypothetical protein
MRTFNHSMSILVPAFLLLLTGGSAIGGDGVNVTISNNTTSELRVTVYDLNTQPARSVVSNYTINGFGSIIVAIAPDDSGQGHLSWTATADGTTRECGHHDKPHLNDTDVVHVYANSECLASD